MKLTHFAPVLIPTLNRYTHLKRCLGSLARNTHAHKTDLYIALDAPLNEHHREGYNKIDKYLETLSGFKAVHIVRRTKNIGATKNTLGSLEDLFEKHDEVILSEDDNYFSPNFLDYTNKGLQLFRNRKDIFAICGYSYPIDIPKKYKDNYWLFQGAPGWGIGLWKNKYKKVDLRIGSVIKYLKSVKNILFLIKRARYLLPHLLDIVNKNLIAGDTIFSMYMVNKDMYCVLPTISKVRNYGNDGTGVNCGIDKDGVFANQEIDHANHFEFSQNIDQIREATDVTSVAKKWLGVSNLEIIKRAIIYHTRNTKFLKFYKRVRNKLKET